MPVVSWRVDEDSLAYFLRYCDLNGLTKSEGFKDMVEVFRGVHSNTHNKEDGEMEGRSYHMWYNGEKKDLMAHLHRCFAEHGGELRKENRCFLANEKFVIYVLYRAMSREESKVVKVTGSCVKRLESIAHSTGRIPLIAVLAKPEGMLPFYGVLPLDAIKTVLVEVGSRNAGYPFFRRKNGESLKEKVSEEDSVFIHVRHDLDRKALMEACRNNGERPEWVDSFYGGNQKGFASRGSISASSAEEE